MPTRPRPSGRRAAPSNSSPAAPPADLNGGGVFDLVLDAAASTAELAASLRDLAGLAAERLRYGDVDAVGEAMRKGWEAKRQLAAGISNAEVDMAVERALEAGATGAKLTGAGGGGFLLIICPMERQRAVRESLADMRELPVKLDLLGSRIVLNVLRDIWS